MLRAFAASLALAAPTAGIADTILDVDFCGTYYTGTGDCAALRAQVVANHSRTLPTLELGDPSLPPMYFIHGWPDTAALWANQFEYFCAPPTGKFFCIAPSWYSFHPDLPTAADENLFYGKQIDAFQAVAVDMGLKNITLVIHDFGCITGTQYVWRYPEMVQRIVMMDIANEPGGTYPLAVMPPYQTNNIKAYQTNDDALMKRTSKRIYAPCAGCSFVLARIGWPYYDFVRNGTGEEFHEQLAPDVPKDQWKFAFTPDFPDGAPILFLWGKCETSIGGTCVPRVSKFFTKAFTNWVEARPGSAVVPVDGVAHWIPDLGSANANAAMAAWLQ